MVITTLTGKNQTTLGMEFVKLLGLKPGTRLRQSLEGHRIIIEPIGDVMTAYGALKSDIKAGSIAEETEAAERSIAEDAMKSMRDA
jgi:bifunctional DNA-binding transcriptional regulator/antitoxin component of YhaV-PrlF toxin-antitoxin module